jgi:hypothetical protein
MLGAKETCVPWMVARSAWKTTTRELRVKSSDSTRYKVSGYQSLSKREPVQDIIKGTWPFLKMLSCFLVLGYANMFHGMADYQFIAIMNIPSTGGLPDAFIMSGRVSSAERQARLNDVFNQCVTVRQGDSQDGQGNSRDRTCPMEEVGW